MKAKRIFAILGLIVIVLWIIGLVLTSILDFPNKASINRVFIIGIFTIPIMFWILFWMIGVITGKKNVASFRSEEMEETMKLADEIKYGNLNETSIDITDDENDSTEENE